MSLLYCQQYGLHSVCLLAHVPLILEDIEVVTYEAMTRQCGRSVVKILVVRVDIGMVIYAAMTFQCGRSVVQALAVRV